MKKIVILGASAACVAIINEAKNADAQAEITIIGFDGYYPYQRDKFDAFISKDIDPQEVFAQEKKFYEESGVNVILDRKISRINPKRKIIFLEDKGQIEYDALIIADTPENRFPEIKGKNKSGIFGYKKLKDVDQLAGMLPLIDTVAVQSDSFTGLQAAAAIARKEREAILVTSENGFICKNFDDDVRGWLIEECNKHNLRIIADSNIEEILGDKDAKAIKVKGGKVYSSQAIVFIELNEDLKLFAAAGLNAKGSIDVNREFMSPLEGVYAIDMVSSSSQIAGVKAISELNYQSEVVVASIFGTQKEAICKPIALSLKLGGMEIEILGNIKREASDELIWEFDQSTMAYRALIIGGNLLKGAILINRAADRKRLWRMICNEEPIGSLLDESILSNEEQNTESSTVGIASEISTELVDN